MYTLEDYYNNNIPDDLEYWNDDEIQRQIDQCYKERELQEERLWQESFHYMSIRRIAREARDKRISYTLIYKFFKEYELQLNEQVWFWYYMEYNY